MSEVEMLLQEEPMDASTFTARDLQLFVECIMGGNISDKYVNKSILAILEQKNAKQKWCLFLRDFLLNKEAYEVLHMLDLEGRYSI